MAFIGIVKAIAIIGLSLIGVAYSGMLTFATGYAAISPTTLTAGNKQWYKRLTLLFFAGLLATMTIGAIIFFITDVLQAVREFLAW